MIEGLKDKVVVITGGGHGIGKAYPCRQSTSMAASRSDE
jgi:NADP-dependent 3-hydroxy acid dehydrogenase YdfG